MANPFSHFILLMRLSNGLSIKNIAGNNDKTNCDDICLLTMEIHTKVKEELV